MRPVWFGPQERPLFGYVHQPVGSQFRGGVLLCPPLGLEAVSAGYAYRTLADQLAQAGFFALRFDYDGSGDSAGHQNDAGRVAAWVESIRTAARFLRGFDPRRMSVVGMRMGATLAVEAISSESLPVEDLVLWDPCVSGKRFLREQGALWRFAGTSRANDDGSVETPGLTFDKETATDLSGMLIADAEGPFADGVLLLTRTGRKVDRSMSERLSMPHVEHQTIGGQEELVGVEPGYAVVPDETLDLIVDWLIRRSVAFSERPDDVRAAGWTKGVVGKSKDGADIEEEVQFIGSSRLFGITTSRRASIAPSSPRSEEGESEPPPQGSPPRVFFLNAGVIDHVGPARLWVELSRAWAEAGFRVVRFDLTGLGESSAPRGRPQDFVYAPNAIDEVVDVLRELSPEDPSDAVLVGLCSGAYTAIEGAIAGRIRGVCLINPALSFAPPEVRVDAPQELQSGKLDRRRQATGAKKDWTRVLPSARGLLGPMVHRLPDSAWWILNRLVVQSPPGRTFSKLVDRHTRVFLIAGEDEARLLRRGEHSRLRRLQRTGLFELEVVPDLEHSLFEQKSRELAGDLLSSHMFKYYCPKDEGR